MVVQALDQTTGTQDGRIATIPDGRRAINADWPNDRKQASVEGVLGLAGTLWTTADVIRAGRWFVQQLLCLSGLHAQASQQARTRRTIDLALKIHGDIAFWKWVWEAAFRDASFTLHVKRAPRRKFHSDRRRLSQTQICFPF